MVHHSLLFLCWDLTSPFTLLSTLLSGQFFHAKTYHCWLALAMSWLLFSQILNPVTPAMSRVLGNQIGCLSHKGLRTGQALEWTSIQWFTLFMLLTLSLLFSTSGKDPIIQLFSEILERVHTPSSPSSSLLFSLLPRFLFSQFLTDF